MREGFQLDVVEVAEHIHADIGAPGWNLRMWLDSYVRPDLSTNMRLVHDPVDRAVVVFVGSREEAAAVAEAARLALEP